MAFETCMKSAIFALTSSQRLLIISIFPFRSMWMVESSVSNCRSWTKLWPLFDPGGSSPIKAYLMHSIIVVFPQPFSSKISVSSEKNVMVCGLRLPVIQQCAKVISNIVPVHRLLQCRNSAPYLYELCLISTFLRCLPLKELLYYSDTTRS